jgi:hypothetical protein
MKISHFISSASVAMAVATLTGSAAAAAFTPGNIVVLRVGDGVSSLNGNTFAAFLDEFNSGGTLVQSVAIPTAASGSNLPCTNVGNSTTEGMINVSADGQYIVNGGYNLGTGTSGATGANDRVIARIAMNGTIDTSTKITGLTSGNIRAVTSNDGSNFWAATSANNVVYSTLGQSGAGIQLSSSNPNIRTIGIFAGQLYLGSASTPLNGVSSIGTGLPITSGQSATLLTGFPGTTSSGARQFAFASATKIYLGDDRATASGGGLQEWTLNSGTWSNTNTYTGGITPNTGGLIGVALSGDGSTVYATNSGNLFKMSTSTPGTFTSIATPGTNKAYRGVVVIPGGSAVSEWSLY